MTERPSGIYARLGVRRVINADARRTRLGGSLMPEAVLDAMVEASRSHVDILELQRAIGTEIARLTANEAAYVCTGASAGIVLSTLATMTGTNMTLVSRLPDPEGIKNEVVIHRNHRTPFDHAVRMAGATLVEIGDTFETFTWDLEGAIGPRTAAVLYMAGDHFVKPGPAGGTNVLPLHQTIEIAHACGVPVIVDAAAQLPPVENLWRFTRDLGADLAIFSGGKDLRGPQASGLVVGRRELIEGCIVNGSPYQRYARAMKVGKEEMVGLLKAVELYLQEDQVQRSERFEQIADYWVAGLSGIPGVSPRRVFPNEAAQPIPRVLVEINAQQVGRNGIELAARLWERDPRIAVKPSGPPGFYLTPDTLAAGDEEVVLRAVKQVLAEREPAVAREEKV